jgi:hypothetical protein
MARIHSLGYKRLHVSSDDCKSFKNLVRGGRNWSLIAKFVATLYGYHGEQLIHEDTEVVEEESPRKYAVHEIRQRYFHVGFEAFSDLISYTSVKRSILIPAFIVTYVPTIRDQTRNRGLLNGFNKAELTRLLWEAISNVGSEKPNVWTLPPSETDAAANEIHNVFLQRDDLRPLLNRSPLHRPWGSAVIKAALLQTNWLLRDDRQLHDLVQSCILLESKWRIWVESNCERKARIYISEVVPDWHPPRVYFDDVFWPGLEEEIMRAMSVSIALRHRRLEGFWLWWWKVRQFFSNVGLRF